jgi:hypothetical protein
MRLHWSQTLTEPLRGLALARERGMVLAWDAADGLHLYNRKGERQALIRAPAPVAAAGCADDGASYAVAAADPPRVWLLAPDLMPRWDCPLPQPPVGLALSPLGERLAIACAGGALHVLDGKGRPCWQADTPRPLRHLAFVPERPILVGSADFGLVMCFDAAGQCLWRDGLVAHVGSLAVSGDGDPIVLACFSDGLCCYAVGRGTPQRLPLPGPCPLAAVSYVGDTFLTAERSARVCLRKRDGRVLDEWEAEAPPVALALAALADYAVLGLVAPHASTLCAVGNFRSAGS